MKIEIVCNRSGIYGGLRRLYFIASYLIDAGHTVAINFADKSSNSWFRHNIPENIEIEPDIRICPETYQCLHPTAKNILYVQAQFDPPEYIFDKIITTTDYLAEVVSTDGYAIDYCIPYGFDKNTFKPVPNKRIITRVGYMPRKNKEEANLIKSLFPSNLEVEFYPIDGLSEEGVVDALQSCNLFLALSPKEGFGCPPFEASLCGCLIIGYHGYGGKKWLTPETIVPTKSPQEFIPAIIGALNGAFEERRHKLHGLISTELTLEKEKEAWLNIINALK